MIMESKSMQVSIYEPGRRFYCLRYLLLTMIFAVLGACDDGALEKMNLEIAKDAEARRGIYANLDVE